jgi:hypothetical protein
MKIDIKPVEKTQGLIRKTTFHGVELSVLFSEEEQAIIRQHKLELTSLMDRPIPPDVNADKVENRGLVKKLAIAATSGVDSLGYHLTFRKLLRGPDTYFFKTPIDAKEYIAELKEVVLPLAKAYLEGNKEVADSDSFEL